MGLKQYSKRTGTINQIMTTSSLKRLAIRTASLKQMNFLIKPSIPIRNSSITLEHLTSVSHVAQMY